MRIEGDGLVLEALTKGSAERGRARLERLAGGALRAGLTTHQDLFLVSFSAGAIRAICRRRADYVIENLARRQQVTALKMERPRPTPGRRGDSSTGWFAGRPEDQSIERGEASESSRQDSAARERRSMFIPWRT